MPPEAHFTHILVRVPAGNPRALWLRIGTVRYGFLVSWFFNTLRDRFVPVRFRRRRYGTVHPSIRGCTRTTPVPPDPYRGARAERPVTAESPAMAGRVAMPAPRLASPVRSGAHR